jgi:hypothetical protein
MRVAGDELESFGRPTLRHGELEKVADGGSVGAITITLRVTSVPTQPAQ